MSDFLLTVRVRIKEQKDLDTALMNFRNAIYQVNQNVGHDPNVLKAPDFKVIGAEELT